MLISASKIEGSFQSAGIMHFERTNQEIGLAVRKPKDGPEQTMVMRFIESMTSTLLGEDTSVAVFREPRVEGAFPDLVIATFDSRVLAWWPTNRYHLSVQDIKILQSIHTLGAVSPRLLESSLGFDSRQSVRSLDALCAAELITINGDMWTPVSLEESFGIRRLIAVEAKISARRSVFLQARRNSWYASESYVLIPKTRTLDRQDHNYSSSGIGMFALDCGYVETLVQPTVRPLPSSYISWLFNEWIGRALIDNAERG